MTAVLRTLTFLLCCLLAIALPRDAAAQDPFTAALPGLAGDFSEKIEAIEKLAALSDGRAVPILQALNDGNLLVRESDKRLAIERDKAAFDALTNEALGPSATGFETARVNNRVRGVLRGALGRLQLVSPDRAQRLAAVNSVVQSRAADNLPLLEQ